MRQTLLRSVLPLQQSSVWREIVAVAPKQPARCPQRNREEIERIGRRTPARHDGSDPRADGGRDEGTLIKRQMVCSSGK